MKTTQLAWRYLWSRPLAAALNVLLLGLGLASITFLTLVSEQLDEAFHRDLAGIDAVVGAKGSPMQLILSGVFHVDTPPGNVLLEDVQALRHHPLVDKVIPISLGDTLAAYRIVGTSPEYLTHYKSHIAQGQVWNGPMQVVLGATVARTLGLQVGHTFAGAHGLAEGGHTHDDTHYKVVGILAAQGGVLDRLILTDLASVWQVHEDHDQAPAAANGNKARERQVSMALVIYKTPMAAMSFPRFVNTQTRLQAAAPALEISRLMHLLGLGSDVLHAFAVVLLCTAGLSVFIALWSAVRERRADLALLRMLGSPPLRIGSLLLIEALWLGGLATVLGLLLGQIFAVALAHMLAIDNTLLVAYGIWSMQLLLVPILSLVVSVVSALLPMLEAYRTDVLALLH